VVSVRVSFASFWREGPYAGTFVFFAEIVEVVFVVFLRLDGAVFAHEESIIWIPAVQISGDS
jgi:hypothetical protein